MKHWQRSFRASFGARAAGSEFGARGATLAVRALAALPLFAFVRAPVAAAAEVDVRADRVQLDSQERKLELDGNVRASMPPFYLASPRLSVTRTSRGVLVEGTGKLSFCPCLSTPLAVDFSRALLAPPGELVLKDPVLRVFGAPVFYAPYFWLRAPSRPGLLPPTVAWRASDGLYLGGGVHVPFSPASGSSWGDTKHALDVRGGGYVRGGFAIDATARHEGGTIHARLDHFAPAQRLKETGLWLEARGARGTFESGTSSAAWDVSALRGERAVYATSDWTLASRPYDRGRAEARHRGDRGLFALGVMGAGARGGALGEVDAFGPVFRSVLSALRERDADLDLELAATSVRTERRTVVNVVSARADGESGATFSLGSWGGRLEWRNTLNATLLDESSRSRGQVTGRTALRVGVPFARDFDVEGDKWVHRFEPALALEATSSAGDPFTRDDCVVAGACATGARRTVVHGGPTFRTSLGSPSARNAVEFEGATGVIGTHASDGASSGAMATRLELRGSATTYRFSAGGAHVARDGGVAFVRGSIGREAAALLGAHVEVADGEDPTRARWLGYGAREASLARYANAAGTTGGVRVRVPWARGVATRGRVDADLTEGRLIGAEASVDWRDRCRCFGVSVTGSKRLGRDGVDLWLAIEVGSRGL